MKLKSYLTLSAVAFGLCGHLTAQTPATATAETPSAAAPATPSEFSEEQILEVLGWYIGKSNGLSELEFSKEQVDSLVRGMLLAREGKDAPADIQKIGPEVDKFLRARQEKYMSKMREKAAADAEKVFAEAKARPGAVALPSGIVYEILQPGSGDFPKPTDTVKVNYTGTLADGTQFDSSNGTPIEFSLSGVIPGWTEGIQKVNKGGKIRLVIPAELAYGEQGQPGIPPNSTLIFEVELLDIKPAPAVDRLPSLPQNPAEAPAPSEPTKPAATK